MLDLCARSVHIRVSLTSVSPTSKTTAASPVGSAGVVTVRSSHVAICDSITCVSPDALLGCCACACCYGRGVGRSNERWNHNIHYHRVVREAISPDARTALDVGTGNGLLAAELRAMVPRVVGIDADAAVLAAADAEFDGIEWIHGDVLTYPLGETFDVVASVAAVHHLPDLAAGLDRLASLTSPGGVLAIIGLARPSTPVDYGWAAAGAVQHRWLSWRRNFWEHSAPMVWPPPHAYSEVRRYASQQLPGARFTRLSMFRYALIWHKPHLADDHAL